MSSSKLAKSINRKAQEAAERTGLRHQLGTVLSANPLQVKLLGSDLILNRSDLTLTQWTR